MTNLELTVGAPVEIRVGNLPSTSQKFYIFRNSFGDHSCRIRASHVGNFERLSNYTVSFPIIQLSSYYLPISFDAK
jgi:hypothetical protein